MPPLIDERPNLRLLFSPTCSHTLWRSWAGESRELPHQMTAPHAQSQPKNELCLQCTHVTSGPALGMPAPPSPRRVAGPILVLLCAWVTLFTSLLLADCFAVEVRQWMLGRANKKRLGGVECQIGAVGRGWLHAHCTVVDLLLP